MQLDLPWADPGPMDPPAAAPPSPHTEFPSAPQVAPRAEANGIVFVRHPRARRYVIRVRDDGSVRVTIPRGGSKREGQEFALRQAGWVEEQRSRLARERAQPRPGMSPQIRRELLERAKRELPARLLELAARHGLAVARVSVRNQRWRWGSCSRNGHICLNWRLVQMPTFVRDYVMIHELMHLKRLDHSPRFWKLVADACPDYAVARAWLRRPFDDLVL